jgi:hypothetical protein
MAYELETYETTTLTNAVLDYLVEFSDKNENFEVTEDSWREFIELATNKRNEKDINEHIIPAMPENPYGMLGLVNYISQYYADNYKITKQVWLESGKNSIFLKVAEVFCHENISFEDYRERMAEWAKVREEDEEDEEEESEEEEEDA